jgi:ankyrin repeat protein
MKKYIVHIATSAGALVLFTGTVVCMEPVKNALTKEELLARPTRIDSCIERGKHIVKNGEKHWEAPPLHIAVKYGRKDTIKYLLDQNADVNQQDNYGQTPLAIAVDHPHTYKEGQTDIINLLMEYSPKKADEALNQVIFPSEGNTLLHLYAKYGKSDLTSQITTLLKHGASQDIPNAEGALPIHLATEHNLAHLKAFLNFADNKKSSPTNPDKCIVVTIESQI